MARVRRSLAPRPKTTAPVDEDAARWRLQIELAEKRTEAWERKCERIVKRYRDDREDDTAIVRQVSRMNIFWSNVQTLKPSLYTKDPVPTVERRYLDRDDTGRVASTILERNLRYQIADGEFHEAMEGAVLDYLLVGRGVCWHRYRPVFGPATSIDDEGDDELQDREGMPPDAGAAEPDPQKDADQESAEPSDQPEAERLLDASAEIEYVHWRDFLHSNARRWEEVEWVARRIFMSRKDCIDWFGEEVGEKIPTDRVPELDASWDRAIYGERAIDELAKATVYEIWCKWDRKVYFIAKGYDSLLKPPEEDPLGLDGFWPCCKPLFATMTNDTLQPVADYSEYQDQALEIDDMTRRIDLLLKALKVAGVYDGSNRELARLLDEGHENKLIAVKNWAEFTGKGGMPNAVSFVPIDMIAKVLMQLFEARDKVKQDLYEITGLADVLRGQADPRETATSVATKGRFGSMRLQARQRDVARFARNNLAIMGEIISEHFPPEVLLLASGIQNDEGVGPPMPEKPTSPPMQPPMGPPMAPGMATPAPGMGHNGGPPMGAPVGAPMPQPPPAVPMPPMAGHPAMNGAQPPMAPPPGMIQPPLHPPMQPAGPQAPPGMLAPVPGGAPAGSMQPPPVSPQMAYMGQLAAWQAQVQQAEMERSGLIMRAVALLRTDKLRGFRIDIETDSTIAEDATEEKGARMEFIGAASGFLEKIVQVAPTMPEMLPLAMKMLMFGVRGFRVGRDLESAFEDFIEKAEKDVKNAQGQPKPPDPKVQAQQLQAQSDAAKAQAEIAKAKIDAQSSAEDNQREMAQKQMDWQIAQSKAGLEMKQQELEAQNKHAEFQMRMAELARQEQIAAMSHRHAVESATLAHAQKMTPAPGGEQGAAPAKGGNDAASSNTPPIPGAERGTRGGWHVRDYFGPGKHGTVVKVAAA